MKKIICSIHYNRNWIILILALLSGGLYVFILPQNHSEAEDAYAFALLVEKGSWSLLFHPFHMIHLFFFRIIFLLGFFPRPFEMMVWMSRIFGFLTLILFFLFLFRRLKLDPFYSLLITICLMASYGFWRYSDEAEVYIMASFSDILLCYFVFSPHPRFISTVIAGVLGAFSILTHVINVFLVLASIPLYFMLQRKMRLLFTYGLVVGFLTMGVYMAVFGPTALIHPAQGIMGSSFGEAKGEISSLGLVKASVAFTQNVISGNFLFAYPAFSNRLANIFPEKMLGEEVYAGVRAPAISRFLAPVTLLVLSVVFASMIILGLKKMPKTILVYRDGIFLPILGWFGLGFLASLGYADPERFIIMVIPLWVILAYLFRVVYDKNSALPIILAAFLVLHNLVGGLLPIYKKSSDYNYAKSAWLIANARENDTILTLDNEVFSRYLRYYSRGKVINLFNLTEDRIQKVFEQLQGVTGQVFADCDVFDPPLYYQHQKPKAATDVKEISSKFKAQFEAVTEDSFGCIYRKK